MRPLILALLLAAIGCNNQNNPPSTTGTGAGNDSETSGGAATVMANSGVPGVPSATHVHAAQWSAAEQTLGMLHRAVAMKGQMGKLRSARGADLFTMLGLPNPKGEFTADCYALDYRSVTDFTVSATAPAESNLTGTMTMNHRGIVTGPN